MTMKLLILALLIAVLIYPVGGCYYFARKQALGDHDANENESDNK